jgi:large subunit ribosomal protein L13
MAEDVTSTGGKREKLANYKPTKHFTSSSFDRQWVLVDAEGQSVGRLASQVATLLEGKHRPEYTPHDDVGDFVVVVNASKVEFRGNEKAQKKRYYKHTGYVGNMKTRTGTEMLQRNPEKVIELAVAGMLPRGSRGSRMLKKLKVYGGAEHPHAAQKPQPWRLEGQEKSA